jgi:adenosylcobinamide-GDP ribazoletransferase
MTSLRAAIFFLTRIPIGLGRQSPSLSQRGVSWFPTVGALIGSVIGLIYVGLFQFLPSAVAAALAVGFGVGLTGTFHLNGHADSDGAIGDRATIERGLGKPGNSRLGTYGTSTFALVLLIEMAALATLGPWVGFTSLVAAHSAGRSATVCVMTLTRKAARESLGIDGVSEPKRLQSFVGICAGSTIVIWVTGPIGFLLLALAIPATALTWAWSHRVLGRTAAGSLGAIAQLSQTSVLVGAVVLNDGACACSW